VLGLSAGKKHALAKTVRFIDQQEQMSNARRNSNATISMFEKKIFCAGGWVSLQLGLWS
jgi:hypothetical protein